MGEDDDLVVTARVLPENREVYEALVRMSGTKGMSQEQVNTQLFNAGLYAWVEQINRDMDKGLPPEDEESPEDEEVGQQPPDH
jgi:hypothetical protein